LDSQEQSFRNDMMFFKLVQNIKLTLQKKWLTTMQNTCANSVAQENIQFFLLDCFAG